MLNLLNTKIQKSILLGIGSIVITASIFSNLNLTKATNIKLRKAIGNSMKLQDYTTVRGIQLGAAVQIDKFNTDVTYSQKYLDEFTTVTAEWEMKPNIWWITPTTIDYSYGIKFAEMAKNNGKKIRGHTLVWHATPPQWESQASSYTNTQLKTFLYDGVHNYVKYFNDNYPGIISSWDVVNEIIDDNFTTGTMRNGNFWYDRLGIEAYDIAFNAAHSADPSAKLFANDYWIENINTKSLKFLEVIKDMKNRGIPINGVGFQGHFSSPTQPNYDSFINIGNQFKNEGLEIQFTEVDFRNGTQAQKAKSSYDTAKACIVLGCTNLTYWGFTDTSTWLANEQPLPFDTNYQPKEIYNQAIQAFIDNPINSVASQITANEVSGIQCNPISAQVGQTMTCSATIPLNRLGSITFQTNLTGNLGITDSCIANVPSTTANSVSCNFNANTTGNYQVKITASGGGTNSGNIFNVSNTSSSTSTATFSSLSTPSISSVISSSTNNSTGGSALISTDDCLI